MIDKQKEDHNKIKVLNFLALVSHLRQNSSKLSLQESFNPLMDDFLNDPDKEILSFVLLDSKESSFKNVGTVIAKYYAKLVTKKKEIKQCH